MKYPVAERFTSPQGEGFYTGTPMAFIRLVGCSVGHKVCTHCDTQFDEMLPSLGGGLYTPDELLQWTHGTVHAPLQHVCITGGEPFDRDLGPLVTAFIDAKAQVHIESSGTRSSTWLAQHKPKSVWLTISPKPGWLPGMVELADELKVIIGGLGSGPGWPSVADAVSWAARGKLVYVQPRNYMLDVNDTAMQEAIQVVTANPTLRLSTQLHKWLRVR